MNARSDTDAVELLGRKPQTVAPGAVACRLGRNFVGVELNPEYAEMAERRIAPHRDQMQMAVT